MTEIAPTPLASGSSWIASPVMDALCAHVAEAGNHPLLHRIRSGVAHAHEVSAWARSRVYLAEFLARKEIFVLAKAVDRDTRRLWTFRLLAIDGCGDFYGPSKQGLIESWRRLSAQLDSLSDSLAADPVSALEPLLAEQLLHVQSATWMESVGMSIVDDWVVRNDAEMALMLSGAGTIPGTHHSAWALQSRADITQNAWEALSKQLGQPEENGLTERLLQSVERRVAFEHAILDSVQSLTVLRRF